VTTKVILADCLEPRVNQIRAICEDWTRAGLITESVWLDVYSEMYEAMHISASGRRSLPTSEWLAELPPGEELRLVVLQPLFDGNQPFTIPFLQEKLAPFELLTSAFGGSINLICPNDNTNNVSRSLIHKNHLNLVAVPRDAISPGAAELPVTEEIEQVYSHIAINLCSAASLWVGIDRIKNYVVGDMKNIQLQKTFVRYVDASELVDEIVAAVIQEATTETSRVFDAQGVEFDSLAEIPAQGAIRNLANSFLDKNKDLLDLNPELPFSDAEKNRKSLWESFKIFGEFLFKYLTKAPGLWAKEKIANLSKKIASKANEFFWGDDSANEVVVNGISGSSVKPAQQDDASVDEKSAAEQLLEVSASFVQKETNSFPPPADPKATWADFAEVCLGLLDGTGVRIDYPMPRIDGQSNTLVLSNPTLVAPALSENSFPVGANLPITMAGINLSASDPYLALLARQQILDALALENSPAVQAELTEQKNNLEQWMQGNSSFVWNVGLKIAINLNEARLRLRKLSTGISTKFSETRLAEAEIAARKSLMNAIKVSLGIFATTAALAFTPLFPVFPVIIVGAAVLMIWTLVGGILFNKAIRGYFQVSNEVDKESAKHEHLMNQKVQFAKDAQRLAAVYIQYQAWSKLLSETIYRPFGEDLSHSVGRVSPIRMLTDLTKSLHVGRLATNASDKQDLVVGVKKKFFGKGWRYENFSRLLKSLGADSNNIFSDPAIGNNSVLAKIYKIYDPSIARDNLLEEAAKSARQLALVSADYSHWPVNSVSGVLDNAGSTCQRFLTPLLASEKFINTSLIKSGDNGTVNAMHSDGAHVYMDRRIPTGSPERVAITILDGDQLTGYQQLDYMAVRIERSELFGLVSLAFLEKTQEEIDRKIRLANKQEDVLPEVAG